MNTQLKKVAVRTAVLSALLGGSSIVACSSSEPNTTPGPGPQAGNTGIPTAGSGGDAASGGSGGTGGDSAGGSAGGPSGGPCTASAECPMGQQCLSNMCGCPMFAPNYCEAALKCTAPMTDPDFCGDCATACGTTQACSEGACTPALVNLAEIAECGSLKLLIAAGTLYVLDTPSGELMSIPLPDGGIPTPIATGLSMATAFAVDATNAYVVAGTSIQRVPLAGGAPAVVVTEAAAIHDVAVAGTTLYYGTGNEVRSIATTAVDGTPASSTPVALAASTGEPQGVAVSGSILLYSSASAMNVERCDTTLDCHDSEGPDMESRGPGHFKIGQSQGSLIFGHRSLQTDGTRVLWVNSGLQGAPIMPNDEGLYPTQGIATTKEGGAITAFAITGTTAYFAERIPPATETDPPLAHFLKSEFGAADPIWLARNLQPVSSIVVDATNAYLASGCNILKSEL